MAAAFYHCPPAFQIARPEAVAQGTTAALPYPILRECSTQPQPRSACSAVLRLTPGRSGEAAAARWAAPQEPWARRGRWRGALGSVLQVPGAVHTALPDGR